jgi:hypothetical protein
MMSAVAPLLLNACLTERLNSGLSPKVKRLVANAVFEVVLEKQTNDQAVYERELNWEVVPYTIRSDKYYSIGTAFAISPTELATAFHVINLGNKSMVYQHYYIRDSHGEVFEVDKITGGSSERDFLIFTVKNRVFSEYFNFKPNFNLNEPVLSIGNALGEGIIVRSGMVLGTLAEPESGRWHLLKSSADGNPGNSGGPLVTPKGDVIGLVTSLRDNILYSTPARVILDYQRATLNYRVKPSYAHLILSNTLIKHFEIDIELPKPYKDTQEIIVDAYRAHYVATMNELFDAAPAYLTGPNNAYLLSSTMSSVFPQIDFVDRNDNNWKLSRLDVKSINFADDGRLLYSTVSDFNFFKIIRPKSTPLAKLDTDPHFVLDTILQNWRTERTLWRNDKYRILSLGKPTETGTIQDNLGRIWITAYWVIGFDDRVLLMYILPLPGGPVAITTIQASGELFVYQWDLTKLCDHIHVPYSSTFEEWDDFLTFQNYRPTFLRDFKYSWEQNKGAIGFATQELRLSAGSDVFTWTNLSELFLLPAYFKRREKIEFGITKVILNRNNRGNDYAVITRNLKPDQRLGVDYRDEWEDLLAEKFPFNGKAALSPKDNNGSMGAVLTSNAESNDERWTLYMTLENPTETELTEKFDRLKAKIGITQ